MVGSIGTESRSVRDYKCQVAVLPFGARNRIPPMPYGTDVYQVEAIGSRLRTCLSPREGAVVNCDAFGEHELFKVPGGLASA